MSAMVTHRSTTALTRGVRTLRRIVMLLLAALGAATAAQAADPASSPAAKPLDLSLPRDAGQWTGVASRVQPQARPQDIGEMQAERGLTVRARHQPYGTGYEARMSRQSAGAAFGAAAAGTGAAGPGPQGSAGAAPRGGAGRGR